MKHRLLKKLPRHHQANPPGTPVFVGERRTDVIRVTAFNFTSEAFEEKLLPGVEAAFPYRDRPGISWIDVAGIHDVAAVTAICEHFNVHPLVQEDITNTSQRAKFEEYDDVMYLVVCMVRQEDRTGSIENEQVSLVVSGNCILTFQERPGDVFDVIRDRIRTGKGRIRTRGVGYLLYGLLDAIVDNYFIVMDRLGGTVEDIETAIMDHPMPSTLHGIHDLRTNVSFFRKAVWPLREAVNALSRSDSPIFTSETRMFIRDVHDHTIQLIDTVETFRELASSLFDMYLSIASHRMNEVMKVLTIIATIFIPITFIAGIYGMNFEGMPELRWRFGYPAVWCVMIAVAAGMVVYFRKKDWL